MRGGRSAHREDGLSLAQDRAGRQAGRLQPGEPRRPRATTGARTTSRCAPRSRRGLEPLLTSEQAPLWAERGTERPGRRPGIPDPAAVRRSSARRSRAATAAPSPGCRACGCSRPGTSPTRASSCPRAHRERPALHPRPLPRDGEQLLRRGAPRACRQRRDRGRASSRSRSTARARVSIGPYRFMREVLCLSEKLKTVPDCGPPVQLDVWSHHPYTSGDPTHRAGHPRQHLARRPAARCSALLKAAIKQKRFASSQPVAVLGDRVRLGHRRPPTRRACRWSCTRAGCRRRSTARGARASACSSGTGCATGPRRGRSSPGCGSDAPPASPATSRRPPSLKAFRFPFVAFRSGKRHVRVWGRTPGGVAGKVAIERSRKGKWRKLRTLRADSNGVFRKRHQGAAHGQLRARLVALRARSPSGSRSSGRPTCRSTPSVPRGSADRYRGSR